VSYSFRHSLASAPEARQDGSGMDDHDIWAQCSDTEALDDDGKLVWLNVPGIHKTVSVPAATLATALGSGTQGQKVTAYKAALADNLNTQPEPVTGWTEPALLALTEANAEASVQATAANEFITVTLGLEYPVPFNL